MIPRTIHRVWLGGPIPPDYDANGDAWARLNPDWKVKLWTDDDVSALDLRNRHTYDAADKIATGADVWRLRSDLARAEILHRFGGVYADCDFEPVNPIGDLLDGVRCFGVEERPGLIANGFIGCTRRHAAMGAYIAAMGEVQPGDGWRVWQATGPGALTSVWQGRDDVDLLPTRLFYPYHHRDLGRTVHIPPDVIAHHTWGSARRRVSVVIPWLDIGCEHRAAARAHVLADLAANHPDWQVIESTSTNPAGWAKGEAIRDGIARAGGDVIAVLDADLIAPGLAETVDRVRAGKSRWAMPYSTLHRLDADATRQVLDGVPPSPDMGHDEPAYEGVVGGGCVVVDRALAERCPPDPRFVGWGGEDVAWGHALLTLGGALWRHGAPVYHLWHPPQERISRDVGNKRNHALYQRWLSAAGNKTATLALIDEANAGAPTEGAPEFLPASPSGWWRHTRTGQLRHASHRGAQRLARDPQWEPAEAPT